LDTGDGGRLEGARLRVDGRLSDLIVTGGENVWPAPVEAVLREHPQVADVAVLGRPDPAWGQRVTAVVVPAGEPPTLDGLRAFVKERLPAYAAPKELVLADRLERTALGKLRRSPLQNRRPGAGFAGENDQE
jgi:O-succinylbenzoic acid--CoA ligase